MKKNSTLYLIPRQKTANLTLNPIYISFQKFSFSKQEAMPAQDLKRLTHLYKQANVSPKKVLKETESLWEMYPQIPEIGNLLSFLYFRLRKIRKGEVVIQKNFFNHPENLLCRINYADQCLRKKKLDKIPTLFQQHFDLTTFMPKRSSFFAYEYRAFMVLMGHFFLAKGEEEKALEYLYLAHSIDPKHPSVVHLLNKLRKKPFKEKLKQCFFLKNKKI